MAGDIHVNMGEIEAVAFLSSLAVHGHVAASTQNQAFSALIFLYESVLELELDWLQGLVRAKRLERLPVVLTQDEVRRLLSNVGGTNWLMASLMYGAGLRLLECVELRVKDVDLAKREIWVRDGKGRKDRVTVIPSRLIEALAVQRAECTRIHERDLEAGAGWVALPDALSRKYPTAGRELAWQWLFPATRHYIDGATGQRRRHHLHEVRRAASGERRRGSGRFDQAGELSHASPFVRDAPARGRLRHPHDPGACSVIGMSRRR
jgi:integrase